MASRVATSGLGRLLSLAMMVISYAAVGWPPAGSASAVLGRNETRLNPCDARSSTAPAGTIHVPGTGPGWPIPSDAAGPDPSTLDVAALHRLSFLLATRLRATSTQL